jgi:TolA-binding protein
MADKATGIGSGSSTSSSAISSTPGVDLGTIGDPDVRRVIRQVVALNQQLHAQIKQQQTEIEALLQMMVEKHIGSLGEFKRHLLKLQQGGARTERIHEQITGVAQVGLAAATTNADQKPKTNGTTPTPTPIRPPRPASYPEFAEPEVDRPRRYTL